MSAAWPLQAGQRLVHHDPGVGQGVALAGGAGGEQELSHRGRQPEAHGGDVAADELHRVVDRHPSGDRPTRAVDVQPDVGVGVLALEVQQLGADLVGDVVVDVGAEHDDAVLEQAVEHVDARVEAPLEPDWARECRHGEWHLEVRHARRLPGATRPTQPSTCRGSPAPFVSGRRRRRPRRPVRRRRPGRGSTAARRARRSRSG